jgi:hypothetical protein
VPGAVDWMFRSRSTGNITVAQPPNVPLAVWAGASAALWLGQPTGWLDDALRVVAPGALALWAGDEVLRGVNPFRRLLGSAALGWLVYSLVRAA